jgi:hypothetical protein
MELAIFQNTSRLGGLEGGSAVLSSMQPLTLTRDVLVDENCHLTRAQNDSYCTQIELSKCVLDVFL